MGLTTLYFAPTAQGLGDGSTAANAAALFSGGAWSTLITGFNFTGATNGLLAAVMAGTYSITAALSTVSFASGSPSISVPLIFHGADGGGNLLTPPSPSWTSDQPAWNDSSLPVLGTTGNITTFSTLSGVTLRLVKLTASGLVNRGIIANIAAMDWCSIANSSSGTSVINVGGVSSTSNCMLSMTGTTYADAFEIQGGDELVNTRITGVAGSGGTRYGINRISTTGMTVVDRVTVLSHDGGGFVATSTATGQQWLIRRSVFANNPGGGVIASATAGQTLQQVLEGCSLTGNGAWGLNSQSANMWVTNNRFDRNTSGNINSLGNYTDFYSYATPATDAADYNNAAGGDYRIASGAGFANRNIGVSQMSSGGSAGIMLPLNMDGGF